MDAWIGMEEEDEREAFKYSHDPMMTNTRPRLDERG